jgi:serine/threonine protein kinase
MFTKTAGSLAFAAPERLKDGQPYNTKVDIWAAGIVLIMVLTGQHPFEITGMTSKLFEEINDGENIVENLLFFSRDLSDEAKDLIRKMMKNDPIKRYSAKECL